MMIPVITKLFRMNLLLDWNLFLCSTAKAVDGYVKPQIKQVVPE